MESTKLVQVNVRAYVWPYPLNQNPLKPLAEEGGEAQVSQVILRLGVWNFVDRDVVFFLV